MKFAFGWFLLFMFFTFVFGWAEVGIIWMICLTTNMSPFLPLLGIAVTFNLCISCACAMWVEDYEKKQAAQKKSLIKRKRTSKP